MRFEVLGPVRVTTSMPGPPVSGAVRLGLLSLLLVRPNTPVAAEVLQDALWGEQDPGDLQRLHLNVHRLRRALGEPDRLVFDAGGYVLRVEPGEVDVCVFDEGLERASRTDDPGRRAEALRDALALWRGSPFQGVDVAGLAAESQRLAERHDAALEQLYAAELERGRHEAVVADLTELVGRYPFRERLHVLLMTALYRCGRQADALAAYRSARRGLVEELGLEPGPELREAERRILSGARDVVEPLAPVPRPPAQLPREPRDFVGRVRELSRLDELSEGPDDDGPVLAVTGTAGVGKTALVTRWAHHVRDRFPDGQLHLDLHGFSAHDPVSGRDALGGLLRALGEGGDTIPPDLAGRVARFRTLTDGRRLLVVLDNAVDADQVRPLLPGSSSCVTVVTSRDSLDGLVVGEGARRLDLGRMSEADARELLNLRLGATAPRARAVADLVERCGRLPLALRVVAERLRDASPEDVAHLVDELGVDDDRLDLLETGDSRTSVRSVLSWSYRQLGPEPARLFRRAGFHCAHTRHYLDPYCASALLGTTDVRRTRRLIDELVRCGLLDHAGRSRYELNDLLRVYAVELAGDQGDAEDGPRRILDYYVAAAARAASCLEPPETGLRADVPPDTVTPPLDDPEAAVRWLDGERSSLVCAAEQAARLGHPAHLVDLSTTLWRYLDTAGHWDEARGLHALAAQAARELGDRTAEGVVTRALGVLELRVGRYDQAAELLTEALALHDRPEDLPLRHRTLSYLAGVRSAVGRTA